MKTTIAILVTLAVLCGITAKNEYKQLKQTQSELLELCYQTSGNTWDTIVYEGDTMTVGYALSIIESIGARIN